MINLTPSQQERFWAKVNKTDECWNWTACLVAGYGYLGIAGRTHRAHRVSWELSGRELPPYPEMVLDHICFNRACVRPSHLRVLPNGENSKRHNPACTCRYCETARGRCGNGHDISTPESRRNNGACRECRRANAYAQVKRYRARKKAATQQASQPQINH